MACPSLPGRPALPPEGRSTATSTTRRCLSLSSSTVACSTTARDRDLERDLFAVVGGATTGRVGWGQVFDRPCVTAELVGILLTQRGWTGTLKRCPACL